MRSVEEQITETLRRYWGFDSFRPTQQEIIASVMPSGAKAVPAE